MSRKSKENIIDHCEDCYYCTIQSVHHYPLFGHMYVLIKWYCDNSNKDDFVTTKNDMWIDIPDWCELEEV